MKAMPAVLTSKQSNFILFPAAALVFLVVSAQGSLQEKLVTRFEPTTQAVHVGVSITVFGVRLTTSDKVVLCKGGSPSSSSNTCGTYNDPPIPLLGTAETNLQQLSSDGGHGVVTLTPQEAAHSLLCVNLFPSKTWINISTFFVTAPSMVVVEAQPTTPALTLLSYEPSTVRLRGVGIVRGLDRLAFKMFTGACNAASGLQSEATAVTWANTAADEGLLTLELHSSVSVSSNIVLCFSSNGGVYSLLQNRIRLNARLVTAFSPTTAVNPSMPTTFTLTGSRLDTAAVTKLEVMAATDCSGQSGASDIPGGDARDAVILSSTQARATFQLGPVLSSISRVSVDSQGSGYLNGVLRASGGGGSGFLGSFTAGPGGIIDLTYIRSPGVDFSSDPVVEAFLEPGNKCGTEKRKDDCRMNGAVTGLVEGTGQTKGCFLGMNITASGDGFGFRAVVASSDVFGKIGAITIVNYGSGYTTAPRLVSSDFRCQCGTDFVDGQPLAASYRLTTIVGNMDPCFTSQIASGAVLSAIGGWQDRNVVLCSRFGRSVWGRVGTATLGLNAVSASPVTPAVAPSGKPFTVTVTGTGFTSGRMSSRIKLAKNCALAPSSDKVGAVIGGEGRVCDTISFVGGSQQCKITFTVFSTFSLLPLEICRRLAGADYVAVAGTALSVAGMQATGINPALAYSTASYVVSVVGVNIDAMAAGRVKVKVCATFTCAGGGAEANVGEPCQGPADSRTCFAGATCIASVDCLAQNRSDSSGVIIGGDGASPVSFGGCDGQGHDCTSLVFDFTLLSMITVPGILWISDEDGVYQPVPGGDMSVEGSEITGLTAVPSNMNSAASFTFTVTGRNFAQDGPGAIKFKYSNSTCDAGGTRSDKSWAILGGNGRSVEGFTGTRTNGRGTVRFQLMSSRANGAASLCWKIGTFQYRAVQVVDANSNVIVNGLFTFLTASTVVAYTPSDYDATVGDIALPIFMSREVVSVTVIGTNFGIDGESPMRVRPIAMPFAMDETAQQCVFPDTGLGLQPADCKEYRYDVALEDGGASAYCSAGSSVDSIPIKDYQPVRVGDWTGGQRYAVFDLQSTMLIDHTRIILCWRMSEEDDSLFGWQVVGHVEARSQNQGNLGLIFWSVFVPHTFGLEGAYISSISHGKIVANEPFELTVEGVGFGCDEEDPEVLMKVAVANTFQPMVGATYGGGCRLGATSDSLGAVEGGAAVVPRCISNPSSSVTVVKIQMTVGVEFVIPLELCWTSTTGPRAYMNAFYEGRSALVTFDAAPPVVDTVLINNQPLGAVELMAHVQFSVSLFGTGMVKNGPVFIEVMIAENCADGTSVISGGEARGVDCSFGTSNVTVEFTLLHRSDRARLCLRRALQTEVMVPYLPGTRLQCEPTYCGADSCQAGTNYLFDGFSCDQDCCLEKCELDPSCRYWQYFVIVGRVFRKCQTSAHCFDTSTPTDERNTPFITQKSLGLSVDWQQLGADLLVKPPRVTSATAQQEPTPAPAVSFTIMVQGVAFESTREQVHVKLVDKTVFGGDCNDAQLLNETLDAWQSVVEKRESVEELVRFLTNFSFNGTCAGGDRNCRGGPAPPLTVCEVDNDCVPVLGGLCREPNTGETCLVDNDCDHGGFCNNSLYNLSTTPTPQPPPLRIPFVDLAASAVLPGGNSRLLQVQNTELGFVGFTPEAVADAVICAAVRDPEAELKYQDGNFITDKRYILAMASYEPFGTVTIRSPIISEVFPDHVFTNVPTDVTFGGTGLSPSVVVKLVYSVQGCNNPGAVPGGESRSLDWVNSLGTNASVKMTITEQNTFGENDEYFVCYRYMGRANFRRAGSVRLKHRPPIVIGFRPHVIFRNEPTEVRLQGSGLGAGQKMKLVYPGAECRGPDLLSALHDEWGVAAGSHASVVEQMDGRRWAEIEGDLHANETTYSRVSATLTVGRNGSSSTEEELHLCLKYSDKVNGQVAAGYHKIGSVTIREPKVTGVVTQRLHAGQMQEIALEGQGLRSRDELEVRIVQTYCNCQSLATDDSCSTAGGWGVRVLPSGITSTLVRAEVIIPEGVSTSGRVCCKFHGQAWASAGEIPIGVSVGSVHVQNGAGHDLFEIIEGEPLIVQVSADSAVGGGGLVKLIPSEQGCQGTDKLAGALEGGYAQAINSSGVAVFRKGVKGVIGLDSTSVRACILPVGGSSYQSPVGAPTWPLRKPFASAFQPTLLRARRETQIMVGGKGLATQALAAWVTTSRGSSCQAEASAWQLQSEDGGTGMVARARITLTQTGLYVACLRVSGVAESVQIGKIIVEGSTKVSSVLPTSWLVGNETAMLLVGSGLSATTRVKWVRADGACDDEAFPGGSERGVVELSAAADEAITETFSLEAAGEAKLCTSEALGGEYNDTKIVVVVRQWEAPLLLYPEIGRRSDTQRVEAAMTRVLPACAANWQSDWMLTGPGGYVSRDTPAIVDWKDTFKCWQADQEVPQTYPQGVGYRPPGEDMRLMEAIRNVPLRVVVTGPVGLGDTIFVARNACGGDLTKPSQSPAADSVPGGEPFVVTSSMIIDVTSEMCGGSQAVSVDVTGASRRISGVEVMLTLTEVSKVGEFHRICAVPSGFAQSFDVAGVDLKVGPPVLVGVEPSVVFAGMRVKYTLLGAGLLPGDEVKVMDGERYRACLDDDAPSILEGSVSIVLQEGETTSFTSTFEMQLSSPSTHARMCYRYRGSEHWEEMTSKTQLRTSGYLYGYEGNMHFFFGEIATPQGSENRVLGDNQTISVLAPRAVGMREQETVAREPFTMTVDGNGLTEDGRYIVVPERVQCGGTPNTRVNLVEDGSGTIEPYLQTVEGGEARAAAAVQNDAEDNARLLRLCSGTALLNNCEYSALSTDIVELPSGFGVSAIGLARVCYRYHRAAEYSEVGVINILPPYITGATPMAGILLNKPFVLQLEGRSLASTDQIKVVRGDACTNASLSSRPYFVALNISDPPTNSRATVLLTLTGPVASSAGIRRLCYSYDAGTTFVETGFILTVVPPNVTRVFPTVLSLSAERRIHLYGNAVQEGDRVKIIHASSRCQGTDDKEGAVYGGEGRLLEVPVKLPSDPGTEQWPFPVATSGSAVFLLPRTDAAIVCYLHRSSASWQTVRGADGNPIQIKVVSTAEEALGIRTSVASPRAGGGAQGLRLGGSVLSALVTVLLSLAGVSWQF